MTLPSAGTPAALPRLAWFRPQLGGTDGWSSTTAVIDALRSRYDIDVIDASRAHAFVWTHDRRPYDLTVFELADTAACAFIWPYLLRYPGLLVARTRWLHDSRAESLRRQQRCDDYQAEVAFGGRPLLRAPLLASRLVAVAATHAQTLHEEYPEARIRVAPIAAVRPGSEIRRSAPGPDPIRFGVLNRARLDVIRRAFARARASGLNGALLVDEPERVLAQADAILALHWPAASEWPDLAVAGMAAGLPVVVIETEAVADWPAWDPHNWQPRDPVASATPIVISLDPRDEERSLMLTMRRLAVDAPWRMALGAAGHAWWQAHASPNAVIGAWTALVEEAMTVPAAPEPAGWPPHLRADGSQTARDILEPFRVETDILSPGFTGT